MSHPSTGNATACSRKCRPTSWSWVLPRLLFKPLSLYWQRSEDPDDLLIPDENMHPKQVLVGWSFWHVCVCPPLATPSERTKHRASFILSAKQTPAFPYMEEMCPAAAYCSLNAYKRSLISIITHSALCPCTHAVIRLADAFGAVSLSCLPWDSAIIVLLLPPCSSQ